MSGVRLVQPIYTLLAFEQIRQLLARRARLLDDQQWEELVSVYADDVRAHHLETSGSAALIQEVARRLYGVQTVHQIHLPEIELTSLNTARAITPFEDLLVWEEGGTRRWVKGFGRYHQAFRRNSQGWVISDHHLVRQHLCGGIGEPGTGSRMLSPGDRFFQPTPLVPAV